MKTSEQIGKVFQTTERLREENAALHDERDLLRKQLEWLCEVDDFAKLKQEVVAMRKKAASISGKAEALIAENAALRQSAKEVFEYETQMEELKTENAALKKQLAETVAWPLSRTFEET